MPSPSRHSVIRLIPLLAALFALALFAGCGSSSSDSSDSSGTASTAAPATDTTAPADTGGGTASAGDAVTIQNFKYDPDPIEVAVGSTVTFTNDDSAPHTATADDGSFDTGTFNKGESKTATFDAPGEVAYTCTIHPFMHGTIEVK